MRFIDRFALIGKPSQEQFQKGLDANPKLAFELLEEHTSHKSYQQLSRRIPKTQDRFAYEWIINPYQYVRQAIDSERFLEFSVVLRNSSVWRNAAPNFVDSSAWTRVIRYMLEHCPDSDKAKMVSELNANGLLTSCFEAHHITPEVALREWNVGI